MIAWFLVAALAGGPDPIDPAQLTPFHNADVTTPSGGNWWSEFSDPLLNGLVLTGVKNSPQVGRSFATVKQVRGGSMTAFAPLLPRASFDITTAGQPIGNVAFCAVGPPDFANPPEGDWCFQGNARLNASWQVDIFGRNTLGYLASRYDVEASMGDLGAQALSVSSAIVSAYLDHVAAKRQLALLTSQAAAQHDLLEVLELRYDQGGSSSLDVLQQRSATAATEALVPPTRLNVRATGQQLAVLLGQDPAQEIETATALPSPAAPPDPGTPAELVARRPDTRAAKARWDASRMRLSSTAAELLPTLQAQASTGWNYAYTNELDTLSGWTIGGSLSVPLFNGGSTHGRIQSAQAQRDQGVHAWNQAVLNAVSDVRLAAARDLENQKRREAVDRQLEASRQAYDESRERYLSGVDSFIRVLTAWNSLQQAEIGSLQAHRDVLTARIALHVALGDASFVAERDRTGANP